ncbi:MAG: potassium transporter KefA, partial [Clostridiales bacterium]|nr:potassium transporter KefA [Clostridiales bacterium]
VGVTSFFIKPKNKSIYARDGFAITAIGWILLSFFGALPFYFSGSIPSLVDGFFEASSGFTTTGSSILQAVEGLPQGILFWRSFTHWIGGMGVLVLAMAILPSAGAGSFQIMKAERPGPTPGKLVPKVRETAKILYGIYIIFTVVEAILLKLVGMSWFDSLIHTFGSVGTGGFSNRNASIGSYSNVYIEIIITVFTFLCGANFALYYYAFKGNIKSIFKDEEFRIYSLIVAGSIALIAINIYGTHYKSIFQSVRYSAFQVVTIITTTGFATADFNTWPTFSKIILFFLMFIGGCAGSTGGGIKNVRILLLLKSAKRDLLKIIHPRAVYSVRYGEKSVDEKILSEVTVFFFMFITLFCLAVLVVSVEGKDIVTTLTAVATTIGNVGPGLEIVGPMGNFSSFTDLSKIVLSFCMIIGRLEIYPILLLASRRFWRK